MCNSLKALDVGTYHFLWEDFFQIQCAMWHDSFLIYFDPSILSYRSIYLNSLTLIDMVTTLQASKSNNKIILTISKVRLTMSPHLTDPSWLVENNLYGSQVQNEIQLTGASWSLYSRISEFLLLYKATKLNNYLRFKIKYSII